MVASFSNDSIKFLEEQGLLIKKPDGFAITNIQEIELNKLYSPKVTSSPENIQKSEKSKYRARAIESINTQFFQGLIIHWLCNLSYKFFQVLYFP